ncbi:MAG: 50S ribosomal protein L6 [Candidatus Altiarchaeota archaeon]|nr:50S ribosomal protein L6 [Candidatus Altiarchaeota archaeon]
MTSKKDGKKEKEESRENDTRLSIEIPEGVEVSIEGETVRVKGIKGELMRKFPVNPTFTKKDNTLLLSSSSDRRSEKAILGSSKAHIQNMIHGVTDGITYKMKIVYSHFPMNVKVQGNTMVIDNFLGEKHPRRAQIKKNVNVEVKGQDVTVKGTDKELVSQTAANIENATRIKGRDHRVFQDGIYITEKDGKHMTV